MANLPALQSGVLPFATRSVLLHASASTALLKKTVGAESQEAAPEKIMSVFKRGNTWWYEFQFNGSRIRESAKSTSKTIARDAERNRRRDLERGMNSIERPKRVPLFKIAAAQWLASRAGLAPHTVETYRTYVRTLIDRFGGRLVSDFSEDDVATLIRKRQAEGFRPRRINFELAVLRMVLRDFGLWDAVKGRVRPLRTPHDVGKAISREDEARLSKAISQSRSPALLPLFVLSVDTGLRASETRNLRHRDLNLEWEGGAIEQGWLVVSRSKTEGGTGRAIPLTRRACAALTLWLSRFPQASPDTFVFPSYRIAGNGRGTLYGVDSSRPVGSWKRAWRDALRAAELHYRWHDLRHTFVSRLAENPAVSEQTIMALAGHVSKSMLARYSHIRAGAKQAAIDALEAERVGEKVADFATGSPQNPPQSEVETGADRLTIPENTLN
jgi:integrase